jgi:hypothetical protein
LHEAWHIIWWSRVNHSLASEWVVGLLALDMVIDLSTKRVVELLSHGVLSLYLGLEVRRVWLLLLG